jgi:prevent-host-death family protein
MRRRRASEVKERWRDVVADAKRDGEVTVTNHERPEVVVLSIERYQQLTAEAAANDPLRTLHDRFEKELAALRAPDAASRLRAAFAAKPAELARAANRARSKRRRR